MTLPNASLSVCVPKKGFHIFFLLGPLFFRQMDKIILINLKNLGPDHVTSRYPNLCSLRYLKVRKAKMNSKQTTDMNINFYNSRYHFLYINKYKE